MSSITLNFPPLRSNTPLITDKTDFVTPDAHRALLELYNGFPLVTLSTVAGPASFPVPLAQFNQNVEMVFVKTSADANVPTLTASGSDKINGAGSQAMATAQYSKMRLKSDGVSQWYIVG